MRAAQITYPSGTPCSWNVPLPIKGRPLWRRYRRCHVTARRCHETWTADWAADDTARIYWLTGAKKTSKWNQLGITRTRGSNYTLRKPCRLHMTKHGSYSDTSNTWKVRRYVKERSHQNTWANVSIQTNRWHCNRRRATRRYYVNWTTSGYHFMWVYCNCYVIPRAHSRRQYKMAEPSRALWKAKRDRSST